MRNPFKTARSFFRRRKTSATTSIIIKSSSGVVWTPEDYANFAKETFLKNIIAYRCIDLISKSIASVPWGIKKRLVSGGVREADDHPLMALLRRPSPDKSWSFLMTETLGYLLISGNNFFEKVLLDSGPRAGTPRELYSLRPDRIKILTNPDRGYISGYSYTAGSISKNWLKDPITGECEILQIKTFHPIDDFWGAGTTLPASHEIDTANEATRWNKNVLQNDGRPGLVFTVGGYLTDEQYDRLERSLQEDVSGADNARKNLIVEGEKASVVPYGWNPAELDFLEGSRELNRRIAFAYGVPPMLVGIPGDNTYSNYEIARMAFWEDTIMFYLNQLKEELSYWLLGKDNPFFIDYDLNNIPALAPKRVKMWEMAERSDFLSLNEKRKLTGFDEKDDGDVILVPINMIPMELAGTQLQKPQDPNQQLDPNNIESYDGEEGIDGQPQTIHSILKRYTLNESYIAIELYKAGFTLEEIDSTMKVTKEFCKEIESNDLSEYVPCEGKPFENEYSCRLKDPSQFEKFARVNNAGKVNGKRIDFIYGIKSGKSTIQAIRYPKSAWSKSEARSHCNTKEHILFE